MQYASSDLSAMLPFDFQKKKMNAGTLMGREFVSELLGTMVLIMFGCGSVAQSV